MNRTRLLCSTAINVPNGTPPAAELELSRLPQRLVDGPDQLAPYRACVHSLQRLRLYGSTPQQVRRCYRALARQASPAAYHGLGVLLRQHDCLPEAAAMLQKARRHYRKQTPSEAAWLQLWTELGHTYRAWAQAPAYRARTNWQAIAYFGLALQHVADAAAQQPYYHARLECYTRHLTDAQLPHCGIDCGGLGVPRHSYQAALYGALGDVHQLLGYQQAHPDSWQEAYLQRLHELLQSTHRSKVALPSLGALLKVLQASLVAPTTGAALQKLCLSIIQIGLEHGHLAPHVQTVLQVLQAVCDSRQTTATPAATSSALLQCFQTIVLRHRPQLAAVVAALPRLQALALRSDVLPELTTLVEHIINLHHVVDNTHLANTLQHLLAAGPPPQAAANTLVHYGNLWLAIYNKLSIFTFTKKEQAHQLNCQKMVLQALLALAPQLESPATTALVELSTKVSCVFLQSAGQASATELQALAKRGLQALKIGPRERLQLNQLLAASPALGHVALLG